MIESDKCGQFCICDCVVKDLLQMLLIFLKVSIGWKTKLINTKHFAKCSLQSLIFMQLLVFFKMFIFFILIWNSFQSFAIKYIHFVENFKNNSLSRGTLSVLDSIISIFTSASGGGWWKLFLDIEGMVGRDFKIKYYLHRFSMRKWLE